MSVFFNWEEKIEKKELEYCSNVIKNEGLIIFPTETVYGIGGNALSENVIKKIYNIKKRPTNKPLNILLYNKKEIAKYAIIQNEIEQKIIDNFMPGPITIILKKKNNIPDILTAGNDKIGIRIPDNKIILEILKKCKLPLAAPSANISNKPSGINIDEIKKDFNEKVDVFIDGGINKVSQPSTIIQVIDGVPIILRQGKITQDQIEKILKNK